MVVVVPLILPDYIEAGTFSYDRGETLAMRFESQPDTIRIQHVARPGDSRRVNIRVVAIRAIVFPRNKE